MSSITAVNNSDLESAARAAEAEFKRAMDASNEALADLLAPANFAIPDTFNEEVNHRPAIQQWVVCTP